LAFADLMLRQCPELFSQWSKAATAVPLPAAMFSPTSMVSWPAWAMRSHGEQPSRELCSK